MISFIASNKMTDRQIGSAAMLGSTIGSFQGTGLSGAAIRLEQRPTKASEVKAAAAAQAQAYAPAAAANGAGSPNAAQHHLPKTWAFRGLKPWRDPA
ncbi:hypothetical protein [Streptomyces sp. NPDC053048]|uniref:hypothetical protein n=1 Tax=Streptomyces sp. NPDC053048 TaxID=3365694 RepID=UPI0037D7E5C9